MHAALGEEVHGHESATGWNEVNGMMFLGVHRATAIELKMIVPNLRMAGALVLWCFGVQSPVAGLLAIGAHRIG